VSRKRHLAAALLVDPVVHAAECVGFDGYVWAGAIGASFFIRRSRVGQCVRANRHALARALNGALAGDVLALH
jgi:hypothetical protein